MGMCCCCTRIAWRSFDLSAGPGKHIFRCVADNVGESVS